MKKAAVLFPIAFALAAVILVPPAWAQSPNGQQEGPREIEKCQTISEPGSYRLVNNLTFTETATCLQINANTVTIDLAGFTISGPPPTLFPPTGGTAIAAGKDTIGITVRNGSITSFAAGVVLDGDGSIVEGLTVFGASRGGTSIGISATGIVKGNTVVDVADGPGTGTGISATGTITGNYVTGSRAAGIQAGQGSTVIGNTAIRNNGGPGLGIFVDCPSNVTNNIPVKNTTNLALNGDGCTNTNNVAP